MNSGFNPTTKETVDDAHAMMSKTNTPKKREVGIMRLANRRHDIFLQTSCKTGQTVCYRQRRLPSAGVCTVRVKVL